MLKVLVFLSLCCLVASQERKCPFGFFACHNGECLSPKWRCDGHYDCDDLTDELNCTQADARLTSPMPPLPAPLAASTEPAPAGVALNDEPNEIHFESNSEPLMLFSTGSSIRGLWMQSKIYFDVITNDPKPVRTPSITGAWSVFFDMLNLERAPPAGDQAKADDTSVARVKNTIVGLDMDPDYKQVYWVELGKESGVYSVLIDDEQFDSRRHRRALAPKRMAVVESGLLSPEDVALDLVGRNMYITDAGIPAIVVCSLHRGHSCKVLSDSSLHKPRAIIADPSTGWLTFTDWGDNPGIYLMSMDGTRRETLIDTDAVWPNGLAADYQSNQLYWADAGLMKIEAIDLKTRKRRTVVKEKVGNPFSLSVFESNLYWSDWSGSDIKTCNKVTGNNTKSVLRAENIYGIHIFHPNIYAFQHADPCWSKRCSHLCLLSPSAATYADRRTVTGTCACPDTMALAADGDGATCRELAPKEQEADSMLWLVVLLLALSFAGLATLVSLLVLYRQGRLPRQVSDFSVSFITQKKDDDGSRLLLT